MDTITNHGNELQALLEQHATITANLASLRALEAPLRTQEKELIESGAIDNARDIELVSITRVKLAMLPWKVRQYQMKLHAADDAFLPVLKAARREIREAVKLIDGGAFEGWRATIGTRISNEEEAERAAAKLYRSTDIGQKVAAIIEKVEVWDRPIRTGAAKNMLAAYELLKALQAEFSDPLPTEAPFHTMQVLGWK